jgi:hypothetical protein
MSIAALANVAGTAATSYRGFTRRPDYSLVAAV